MVKKRNNLFIKYNYVIKRNLFRSVAGRLRGIGLYSNKGVNIHVNRPYATGDRYHGKYKFGNQTVSDLKKQGKDTDAIQKHSVTAIEDENGKHKIDSMATHSSYKNLTTGVVENHTKVGDGKSDYAGRLRSQFVSTNEDVLAEIDMKSSKTTFTPDPLWKKYCEDNNVREQELLQKKQDVIQKELLKNKDKEDV